MMADKRDMRSVIEAEQLKFALDHVQAYVFIKDTNSRYLYANKKTLAFFGCSQTELIGKSDADFFPPEVVAKLHKADLKALRGQATQEEVVIEREGGGKEAYLEWKSPVYANDNPNQVVGVLGISTDITHQKSIESTLIAAATKDPLTGLSNRRQLIERLEMAQKRSQRTKTYCAVIFLDLDGFKQLNDCYGHGVGDAYLVEVARRIRSEVRDLDGVARIGGDEFVVLLEGLSCDRSQARNSVKRVVQKVINALDQPFPDIDPQYTLAASAGCALFIGTQRSCGEILVEADERMYKDKRKRAAARIPA